VFLDSCRKFQGSHSDCQIGWSELQRFRVWRKHGNSCKRGRRWGGVVIPVQGLGGFDWEWRISRIDARGLHNAFTGVGTRFPWGAFDLIRLRGADLDWEQDQLRGGAGVIFLVDVQLLTLVVPTLESMALKELGYFPWRLHGSRSTCCPRSHLTECSLLPLDDLPWIVTKTSCFNKGIWVSCP
jgi:hypothetical protein